MTVAEDAYRAAQKIIETARKDQSTILNFDIEDCRSLEHLPPEISTLDKVTRIDLRNTKVTDVAPLHGLTQMQRLFLRNTQVADIVPLQGLTKLQNLSLDKTQVADIVPLQGLAHLHTLYLEHTHVTDITPLQGLIQLRNLLISNTQVADIAPLQNLVQLRDLFLDDTQVADIAPLRRLAQLQRLSLANTQIADIAPLQGLAQLQRLSLGYTQVDDITPLQGLPQLKTLLLHNTQVADIGPLRHNDVLEDLTLDRSQIMDLRPIAVLERLGQNNSDRFTFSETPAVDGDAELKRLSEIESHVQRTKETTAYLRTLPPWPAPLPWNISSSQLTDEAPSPPETDPAPRLVVNEAGRLDLDVSVATDADLSDPIKERLYPQLQKAVETLSRFRNYPEITAPASELSDLVLKSFDEADLLSIHLQIGALMDAKDADAVKRDVEKLNPDCIAALNGVLRVGPPITMGHPDVELLEQRALDYARTRQPETVAEGERRIAAGLAKDADIATEKARKTSDQLARSSDHGRVAEYRHPFVKKATVALATIAGALGDAATGHVAGETVMAAAHFVILHKDAIMAVAPSWGETGFKWAEYLLMKADQMIKDAKNDD